MSRTSSRGLLPVTGQHARGIDVCQRGGDAVYPNPGRLPARVAASPAADDNSARRDNVRRHDGLSGRSIQHRDRRCGRTATARWTIWPSATSRSTTSTTATSPTRRSPTYYYNDAIGMENNLWGEIIFTSGDGIPTYGMSTVNIEADTAFGIAAAGQSGGPGPHVLRPVLGSVRGFRPPWPAPTAAPATRTRTSWSALRGTSASATSASRSACVGPPAGSSWPASITTNFRVWRSSPDGGDCIVPEPGLDSDLLRRGREPTVRSTAAPRPAATPRSNFPSRRSSATSPNSVTRRQRLLAGSRWTSPTGRIVYDQAWVDYSFEGAVASRRSWSRARSSIRRPATRSIHQRRRQPGHHSGDLP